MTINKSQFEKGLDDMRSVGLPPEKKGVMFGKLLRYAEMHPAKSAKTLEMSFFAKFWRKLVRVVS